MDVAGAGQSIWLNDPLGPDNGPLTGRRAYGVGYFLGIGAEHAVSPKSALRAELQWNERHSRIHVDESQSTYREVDIGNTLDLGTRSFRLRALQLPLFYTYQAWPDFYVLAGPVWSRIIAVQERFVGTRLREDGLVEEGTLRTDRTSRFRPMELAFLLGFEVEGHGGFRFGVRYCQGLTDLERWAGATSSMASTVQVVVHVPFFRKEAGRP